jgi:two-component sensor histidine kinase/CheY-like chemotaxis protein
MSDRHIKILLIEDNPGHTCLIQEMLSEAKGVTFDSECTDRLSKGLERIDGGNFDVILLDLFLPDSKGFATFRKVHTEAPGVPIIVLSGLDDEELAVKAVQEGAQDYLVKGHVESNLLARSIRYAMGRKQSEDQIRAALKEKEVLLKEIHHRVKNNLQVISSLLKLQSRNIKDEGVLEIFKESQNRVRSMSLIHEKLYRSKDFTNIDFNGYIQDLVGGLFLSYTADTGKIVLKKDVEDISLGVETAIPCGLIINELVSNALKHAFPDGREGEIKIALHSSDENKIQLTISDNGIGIPKDFDIKKTDSLGLHLVNILAEDQLKGNVKMDTAKGTKFQFEFKGVK